MNATNLYVSTSRLILQARVDDPSYWIDLYRIFSCLRQSLSCTVCGELLIEPHTPTETTCQHHVCRLCKGGKKKLKPSCSWCKDYSKYTENVQIRTLLQCYKKLCQYITSSGIYRHLASMPPGGNITVESCNHFLELIKEGSGFKDDYKHPSKNISKIIRNPCKTTSTQTILDGKETKSNLSNGKTSYSVICADDGNRLTIKRTPKAINNVDKRNGKPPSNDKILKKGRQSDREVKRLKVGRKPKNEIQRHEMRKRSQDQTNVNKEKKRKREDEDAMASIKPKKRRPHEENISTKVNKVRKRSVFTKPPTCKCGVQDHCKGSCRGYRCPCYSADKSCLDCECLGCKNPRGASLNKASPITIVDIKNKEENQNLVKDKI